MFSKCVYVFMFVLGTVVAQVGRNYYVGLDMFILKRALLRDDQLSQHRVDSFKALASFHSFNRFMLSKEFLVRFYLQLN